MKSLAYRVKRTSNLTTGAFVLFLAYTINQWHSSMDMDNLINILVLLLALVINIRFYKMYINIEEADNPAYMQKRGEYYHLLRVSLWMAIAVLLLKVFLS